MKINKYFLLSGFLIILIATSIAMYFVLFRQTSNVSISNQIVNTGNDTDDKKNIIANNNQKKISRSQSSQNIGKDTEIEIAQLVGSNYALSVAGDTRGKIFIVRGIWSPIQQEVAIPMYILEADPDDANNINVSPINLPLQESVTNFSDPQMAVDGLGNVHITWSSPSISTPQDSDWDRIWYMKVDNNGTVLVAPQTVINITIDAGGYSGSNFNVGTRDPQIVVDSDNNAYVTWSMWDRRKSLSYIHIAKIDTQGKQSEDQTNTFIEGEYPNISIDNNIAHLVWEKDLGPVPQSQDPKSYDDTPFHTYDVNYAQLPLANISSISDTITLVANANQESISPPSIVGIGDVFYVVAGKYFFELNKFGSIQSQREFSTNMMSYPIVTSPTGIHSLDDIRVLFSDNYFVDMTNNVLHAGIIGKSIVNPASQAIFYEKIIFSNTINGASNLDDKIPPEIDTNSRTLYNGYVKIVPLSLSEIKKKLEEIGCSSPDNLAIGWCVYTENKEPNENKDALEVYPSGFGEAPELFYITGKKLWTSKDIPGPPDPEKFKDEVRQDVRDIKNIIDIQENSWQITETTYPWDAIY